MCSTLFMLLSHARWMCQLLFFCHFIEKPPFLQHPSKSYTEPKPVMKHWNQNCDYANETCVQPFLCLYFMRGRGEKGQLLFLCHYIAKPPCEQHPSKSFTEPKPVMKNWDQNCDYTTKHWSALCQAWERREVVIFFCHYIAKPHFVQNPTWYYWGAEAFLL